MSRGDKNRRENETMYETVKTVKGIAITRMIGTKGFYHVTIKQGADWKAYYTFRTIKAAAEFIEKAL